MNNATRKPKSVRIAQALFILNAVIWLAFGTVTLARTVSTHPDTAITKVAVGLMMFGNAGAMLTSAAGIGGRRKSWYYFAFAVLVVNIILTFTDQFGFFDFATLVIDLVLIGLLIATRAHRTHSLPMPREDQHNE